MDLSAITAMLPDHRKAQLADAVDRLEAGVAAGLVRNQDFTKAKEMVNWCVVDAVEAFLKTGPQGRDGGSNWWLAAYDADALIHSSDVHNLPAILRRSRKHGGLPEYVGFIEAALMPLHGLLQAAKPLIVKRGDANAPPPPKTPAQLAREAAQMTCQCCGGLYLANLGTVAHHGYRRPGQGWQTASCAGAKELPFEVSRDCLGNLITGLKSWEASAVADRKAVEDDVKPVVLRYKDPADPVDSWGKRPVRSFEVTSTTFAEAWAEKTDIFKSYGWTDFGHLKAKDLADKDRAIAGVRREIKEQQARFDGWKRTHRWDAAADGWKTICERAA